MPIPHDIVVAQLCSETSVSLVGEVVDSAARSAKKLEAQSHPFLALKVLSRDIGRAMTKERHILFPITRRPFKSPVRSCNRVFVLEIAARGVSGCSPGHDSSAIYLESEREVGQGLPLQGLYLHAYPGLEVRQLQTPGAAEKGPGMGILPSVKLTEESFQVFRRAVNEPQFPVPLEANLERKKSCAYPDTSSFVDDTWKSFNGTPTTTYQDLMNRTTWDYKLVKFHENELDDICLNENLEDQLLLQRQLIRDYSWTGLRSTMGWIESLRKMHSIPFVPLIEAAPQAFTEVPRLDGDTKASTLRVYASPTIWDQFKDLPQTCNLSDNGSSSKRVSSDSGSLSSYRSNASGESDSSSILDLSYGSTGVLRRFPLVEPHYPEIKTDPKKLRVVIFESFGVILDRNTAINYAMEHIRSVSGSSYSAHTLVLRYNEQEAHVIRNTQLSPAVSLRAIVQDALCRLVYRFAINLSPGSDVLHEALRLIMSPKAYKDAAIAVSRIVRSGIHVVIASPDDPETHQALREELPSGDLHYSTMSTNLILSPYHQKNSPYFEQILSHCQSLYPGTQPQNVLLATVGAARVVEGALWRGIPNALITSPDRPAEARIKLNLPIYPKGGPNPSLEARGLGDLCEQLEL